MKRAYRLYYWDKGGLCKKVVDNSEKQLTFDDIDVAEEEGQKVANNKKVTVFVIYYSAPYTSCVASIMYPE